MPLAIADQDNSEISQKVVEAVEKIKNPDSEEPIFELVFKQNKDEIKKAVREGKANGGLFISSGFGQKIQQGLKATVVIVEDQANPQISQIVNQVLGQVLRELSLQFGEQKIRLLAERSNTDLPELNPVETKIEGIIQGEANYFEFMAPGIMAMVILTAVLTGLASSVSREEETGTIDGIMVAPVSRFAIIIGKSLTQALRGIVQGLIILGLSIILFGVKVYGSFWLLLLLMFLGIFSFVGLGILVSAFATRQETATQLLFMFQLPMILLSGVFFPVQQMPKIIQYISQAIPFTYMVNALRQVLVLGASLAEVKLEIAVLFAFGLLTLTVAVPVFRWVMTR